MITFVLGPPCAGKSTWVKETARPGDVVVDYDQLALALGSQSSHDHPEDIRAVTHAARRAATGRIFEGLEVDAYVIHTRLSASYLDRLRADGVTIHIVDPGMEVCLERAAERPDPEATRAAIRRWYEHTPGEEEMKKSQQPLRFCKSFPVTATSADIAKDGATVTLYLGYAAVFNVVDSYGHIIEPGTFSETIEADAPWPVYWGHGTHDPFFNIGITVAEEEDDRGLKVTMDLDVENNPRAAYTAQLIEQGRVKQMSFMFDVLEYDDSGEYFVISKVKVHEVSIVPLGVNQQTTVIPLTPASAGVNYSPQITPALAASSEEPAPAKPDGESSARSKITPDEALLSLLLIESEGAY